MKNVAVIGLFCTMLIFSSCGSSLVGSYKGELETSYTGGFPGKAYGVSAVVNKSDGMYTIEFLGSSVINICKIEILAAKERGSGKEQTCEVTIDGTTEVVKVASAGYYDNSNSSSKGIAVNILGGTRSGKFVEVAYKGFESGN